jgi:uncharacterized integral membrane protein
MRITVVLAVALSALVAFFSLQNAQAARVSFFSWYVEAPLVLLLLGTFLAGAAAAWLALLPGSVRKSLEISRLKSREEAGRAAAAAPGSTPAKGPIPPEGTPPAP